MRLQRTIKAVIRPGEEFGFVAECLEIPVITQGDTLDEVAQNLQEAVTLHLEGENLGLGAGQSSYHINHFRNRSSPCLGLST